MADFFGSILSAGLCSSPSSYREWETIWLESCASSRAFSASSTTTSPPRLSFAALKSRLLSMHLVPNASSSLSAASAIKLQASNLTRLLNNWDPSTLDEEKCRQLLSVLHGLEKDHLVQQMECEELVNEISDKMETKRLRSLTNTSTCENGGSNGGSNDSQKDSQKDSHNTGGNPLMFYTANITLLEKASLKHTVRSVRITGATATSSGKAVTDVYGFGQTFTDTNHIHAYRGQGSLKGNLVDVLTLMVPKTKVSTGASSNQRNKGARGSRNPATQPRACDHEIASPTPAQTALYERPKTHRERLKTPTSGSKRSTSCSESATSCSIARSGAPRSRIARVETLFSAERS